MRGKLTYSAETYTIPAGVQCAGYSWPFAVARYTWTSSNQTVLEDPFTLNWTTPDGYYNLNASIVASLAKVVAKPVAASSSNAEETSQDVANVTLIDPPSGAASYTWTMTGGAGILAFSNGAPSITTTTNTTPVASLNGQSDTINLSVTVKYSAGANSLSYGPDSYTYNPTPVITSITPSTVMVGTESVQVTILGSGFGSSPTVNLPSGVTSSGQTSSNSQIVLTLVVGYVTPTSSAQVTVTNSSDNNTSKPANIILNGPVSATVQTDILGQTPDGTPMRATTYKVLNLDSSIAASIPISEDYKNSGWNCTNATQPIIQTTTCDGGTLTQSDGQFTDYWSYWGTYYTPANCGDNVTDQWQWCSPSGPTTGITFMTLNGWVHTTSSNINGFVNPPTGIPAGTVFKP
jgi:hypothetical protein